MRMRTLLAILFAVFLSLFVFHFHIESAWALNHNGYQQTVINKILNWLRSQQNTDGGFGQPSDPSVTADVVVSLVAVGENPANWVNSQGVLDYLQEQADTYATSPAKAGRLTLAVVAAGLDPTNFGGVNLVQRINNSYNSTLGTYGDSYAPYNQIYAIWALAAASQPIPSAAIDRLVTAQNANGSWGYAVGEVYSDTNTTAFAVQALIRAGVAVTSSAVINAMQYFSSVQQSDGGFGFDRIYSDTDCNSTALVIQALVAAGQDPYGSPWSDSGPTPLSALLQFRNPSGAFRYNNSWTGDDLYATKDALATVKYLHEFAAFAPAIFGNRAIK